MRTNSISTKTNKTKKTKNENKEKEIKNTLTNKNKEKENKENEKLKKNEWKIEKIVYDKCNSGSDIEPINLVKVHYRYEYIFGVNEYLAYDDDPLGQVTLVSVRPGEGFSVDLGDIVVGPSFLITDSNHPTRILIPRTGIKVITGPHLFGSDIFGNLSAQTLNGSKIFLDNRDGIIKKQFIDQEADVYFMIISRKVIG